MPDISEVRSRLQAAFRPDATAAVVAVYQFTFDEDAPFHARIEAGTLDVQPGLSEAATVTMLFDNHATALAVLTHETDGIAAFMDGRLRSDGHLIQSLMLFAQYFGRPD